MPVRSHHRRPVAGRSAPPVLLRVLPAEGRDPAASAVAVRVELESLGPGLRLGHLRGERLHPGPHHPATEAIAQHTTLRSMAHLTCASQSREQLRRVVGSYAAAGIRHVLAIRGDMPGGPRVPFEVHPEGLTNATELVAMVRELGNFCVGVAAFPDRIRSRRPRPGRADPGRGAEAGASFAITQLFFTAGLLLPGRSGPGLGLRPADHPRDHADHQRPPGGAVRRALGAPTGRRSPSDPRGGRRHRSGSPGSASPSPPRCRSSCCSGGAPGLHFFTQNRSRATREIYANLHQERRRA